MNEGIHLDLDTWIVPGQIRKANLCRGLGNRYTPAGTEVLISAGAHNTPPPFQAAQNATTTYIIYMMIITIIMICVSLALLTWCDLLYPQETKTCIIKDQTNQIKTTISQNTEIITSKHPRHLAVACHSASTCLYCPALAAM